LDIQENLFSIFGKVPAMAKTAAALAAAERVKKVSQSLPPIAANKVKIVFCQGTYLSESPEGVFRQPEPQLWLRLTQ